jgi:hypothetical protein
VKPFLVGILLAGGFCCTGQTPVSVPDQPLPYVAISDSERFHHYVHSMFNTETLLRSAAGSGILQWSDTPSEWGQGTAGYARRYTNSYAQHMIRQTISYGLSSTFDEDNRYLRSEGRGAGSRIVYAINSTFLARRSTGHRRLSSSRIGAVVATAFISRTWQPHSTNGAQNALSSVAVTFASEIGFNVAREFLPAVFLR